MMTYGTSCGAERVNTYAWQLRIICIAHMLAELLGMCVTIVCPVKVGAIFQIALHVYAQA